MDCASQSVHITAFILLRRILLYGDGTLPVRSPEFDKLLQNAIDDALMSLGESVKQAIYYHIESKFSVPKDHVSENLDQFQLGLEKIFGAGARFLEILIMKNLYSKIGVPLDLDDANLEFIKYVEAAEESFLKKLKITTILNEDVELCTEE
jgi:hypothetical protein